MKAETQRSREFLSLNFGDVMWKPRTQAWPRFWPRDEREQIQRVARAARESGIASFRVPRADHSTTLLCIVASNTNFLNDGWSVLLVSTFSSFTETKVLKKINYILSMVISTENVKIDSLGQSRTKQAPILFGSPLQGAPPWAGAGLLHKRVRFLVPLPHVSLHADQAPQLDQFPATKGNEAEGWVFRI